MEIAIIILLATALIAVSATTYRIRLHAADSDAEARALRQSLDESKKNAETIINHLKESHLAEVNNLKQQFATSWKEAQAQAERAKADLREQFEASRQEQQRQWEEKLNTLRLEFDKLSADHLKMQQEGMKNSNKESLDALLSPLKQTIETFQKDFSDKMTEQVKTDAVMKEALRGLSEQTQQLGHSAEHLTKALKADPKKQGDWGEAVLRNILEASGMTEGIDFFTQASTTDEEGKRYVPDVKVKLHGDSYLIIDSKTSIKAYLDYVNAADAQQQAEAVKEHIASVRKHVNELADKHYPAKVKNAAEYVLMFIPNEGSYILAMENDERITLDAYKRHIIIVNPTNLMLALKIVWLFWQNEKQTKNVRDIIEQAKKLYEKFATFSNSFADLGNRIAALSTTYTTAEKQLSSGPGNLTRQLAALKDKGVISDKKINERLLSPEE